MAGPYTHIVLAAECCVLRALDDKTLAIYDMPAYLLGTTVPDMFRLFPEEDVIPRATTHPSFHGFLDTFKVSAVPRSRTQVSFLIGYLVHLIVDKMWDNLVYQMLNRLVPDAEYQNPRLTCLTDLVLWNDATQADRRRLADQLLTASDHSVVAEMSRHTDMNSLRHTSGAIPDWQNRLGQAILLGPEHLGLTVRESAPLSVMSRQHGVATMVKQMLATISEASDQFGRTLIPIVHDYLSGESRFLPAQARHCIHDLDRRVLLCPVSLVSRLKDIMVALTEDTPARG
jgi:hypothetical protein